MKIWEIYGLDGLCYCPSYRLWDYVLGLFADRKVEESGFSLARLNGILLGLACVFFSSLAE